MITHLNFRKDVPIVSLEEVVIFLDNFRKPITEKDRIEGPYPYYGANGIQGYINEYIFDEELVLLAEDGGHFGEPDRGIAYKVSGKCWVNNHAHVLKAKPTIDINYLTRVLENLDVSTYINGTTRAKLTKGNAEKIKIPLPPLEEQQRIAAILDKAEYLKRKRELAIEKLDGLAQSIYRKDFSNSASIKLEEICSFQNGGTPSKEVSEYWAGDIAWISSADIVGSKIQYGRNFITTLGVDNSATNIAPKGAILIVTRTGVGKVAVTDRPTAFSQDIVSITLKKGFDINFVCEALKNNLPYFLSHARGATIQGITRSVLASALIPKVDEGSQNTFGKIISAINERNHLFIKSLGGIESLGSSLQSKAFS
ncbi:restriction endonuclease subunit S [Polynucleobacter paneuropaeus]|nr:restriction endonuclease subunit S [Polynucleobacter paneuropaeus]